MAQPAYFNDDTHTLVYKAALSVYDLIAPSGLEPFFNDDTHTLAFKVAKNMELFVASQ